MRNYYRNNETLVQGMIDSKTVKTPSIIEAFKEVDRKLFVPHEFDREIYVDAPLPIGKGQTISQPSTVAFMLELLGAKKGDKVLDIGSGSGWTAALLGKIVGKDGKVIGLDRQEELVKKGERNIAQLNLENVRIKQASNDLGLPGEKFDAILVSASAPEIPKQLFAQLKVGGTLVIPVQNSIFKFKKLSDTKVEQEEYPGFVFVPLIY